MVAARGDIDGNRDSFALHLRARALSPRTQDTYLIALDLFRRYLRAQGMPLDIANIRREHIEAWISSILDTSKPATALNRYRSLQAFWRWAVDEGEISLSPMAKTTPPRLPDDPPPVPSDDDMRRLLATCDGTDFEARRDQAILRTFIAGGARLAELTGLQRDDLDLMDSTIRVLGKNNRHRTIYLSSKTIKAIDRYVRVRSRHPRADSPALWIGERGPLTTSGVFQLVRRRAKQASLKIHPHLLRHVWAHANLSAGLGETDVMAQAGWRSPAMLRRYARAAAEDRGIAAARKLNVGDRL
jgi:site-specific recombinase XerD